MEPAAAVPGEKYIATLDIGTTTIRCFIYAVNRDIGKLDVVGTAYEHVRISGNS